MIIHQFTVIGKAPYTHILCRQIWSQIGNSSPHLQ